MFSIRLQSYNMMEANCKLFHPSGAVYDTIWLQCVDTLIVAKHIKSQVFWSYILGRTFVHVNP